MLSRLRLVAINDVYELTNLPRLQTFLSNLTPVPCAVLLVGDFLSPSPLSSIDGGYGSVATLRAAGITHFMLGNHEADLPLNVLRARIEEFSKSAEFINTNVRNASDKGSAAWLASPMSHEHVVIRTPDDRVKVALTGFLSDEPGLFFNNKFKGVPISNVVDTFPTIYNKLIPDTADFIIPMTHQSLWRDKELAQRMLTLNGGKGLIIGGHDHIPMDETVLRGDESIRILKSGSDAENARVIDLEFDTSVAFPKLTSIETTLVRLAEYDESKVVKTIADSHLSVLEVMNDEVVLQAENDRLSPGQTLSSERSRFEQTTVGSLFCQAIKEELEADVALINGAAIKGDMTYENSCMNYAQLKKEMPFPTKMVVVPLSRSEVYDAIYYSRNYAKDGETENESGEIPRKGYLQVDLDLDLDLVPHAGDQDDMLRVALPRNLLKGFCNIQPLVDAGLRLEAEGRFPGPDDYIPAIDLVVRHCSKSKWFEIVNESNLTFQELDLNQDGVLDRHEVKKMMEHFLGYEPADFVVDNMIASIDMDENGVIDVGELSFLIATMEREKQWRKF